MIDNYDRALPSLNPPTSNCPRDDFSFRTTSNTLGADQKPEIRKIICRYGRGCTHMHDTCHRIKFWHPTMPALTAEELRTHYVCNECGVATASLEKLQLHLQRKTAWSNKSLLGCRISCLVDFKEWHEGHVTQYHRSGKHYVEFRAIGEKRWLNMKKIVFYIVERPIYSSNALGEYKDDEIFENSGLAPVEEKWMYCDDISLDYAFAQSVLFKVYGSTVQETGHKTKGHICLTEDDKDNAKNNKGSLLYGELLPRGANKAFGEQHLAAGDACTLFDLGMGAGKVAVQAFVQFRNLKYVYGVELSLGRYLLSEAAALRMVRLLGSELFTVEIVRGQSITVTERCTTDSTAGCPDGIDASEMNDLSDMAINHRSHDIYDKFTSETKSEEINEVALGRRTVELCASDARSCTDRKDSKIATAHDMRKGRILKLEFGNMFDVRDIHTADIVMLETDIPTDLQPELCRLLNCMKEGSRTLTYLDLKKTWCPTSFFPFKQLENNKNLSDRFPTSWSVQRGHHFYVWNKIHPAIPPSLSSPSLATQLKALCSNGDRGSDHGIAQGLSANRSGTDEDARKKDPTTSSGSVVDPAKSGFKGGKSAIATGRCLPFSFSNSLRSMFGNENGKGVGPRLNGSNSSKCLRDDNEGNRTAGLVNPKTCHSQATRKISEDSDKVIPLNSDGTRTCSNEAQSHSSSLYGNGNSSGSGNGNGKETWSAPDPSEGGRGPGARPTDLHGQERDRERGGPLPLSQPLRSKSLVEAFTNFEDSVRNKGSAESCVLQGDRERMPLSTQLQHQHPDGEDISHDVDQSWSALGYSIERMAFPLRGSESSNTRHAMCYDQDSDSEAADVEDYRDEDPEASRDLFLDKSPRREGGTWSTCAVQKEVDRLQQALSASSDAASSSSSSSSFTDCHAEGRTARPGVSLPKNASIICFDGPSKTLDSSNEKAILTLPTLGTSRAGAGQVIKISSGSLLATRPSGANKSGHRPDDSDTPTKVTETDKKGKTPTQSEGSGCTMN